MTHTHTNKTKIKQQRMQVKVFTLSSVNVAGAILIKQAATHA
jgi:hypothetical protein